jgi:hypothetical protein
MYSRGAVAVVVAIASLLRRRRALVVRPNERTQARRAWLRMRPCVDPRASVRGGARVPSGLYLYRLPATGYLSRM